MIVQYLSNTNESVILQKILELNKAKFAIGRPYVRITIPLQRSFV